ncbi:MAG: hypothetical protein V2A70_09915, partial [Candidatus Omnitrophota bacterium]
MIDIPDDILPRNGSGELICPKCKALVEACTCPCIQQRTAGPSRYWPYVRIEKSGRKGKVVTLIGKLPGNEVYLLALTKSLKM